MTDEETKKTEPVQEEAKSTEKDFKEKANVVMGKVSEGAKVAGEKAGEAFETFAQGAKKAGAKAGEVLEDLTEGTKKVTAKAGETASDVMDSIISGVRKVSEKASDSVKIMEIKREIRRLDAANRKIMPKITEAVLDLYDQQKIKEPALVNMCKEIEANNNMVEEKLAEIETVKATEAE
jgi:hypothetical protein